MGKSEHEEQKVQIPMHSGHHSDGHHKEGAQVQAGKQETRDAIDAQFARVFGNDHANALHMHATREDELRSKNLSQEEIDRQMGIFESSDEVLRLGVADQDAKHQLKQANEELRAKADIDPKTGAKTHGALMEYMQKLQAHERSRGVREARAHEHPVRGFSLILFDVDDMKKLNDKYGRPKVDEILKQMVDRAKGVIRGEVDGDIIARNSTAADEFFVVLPHTDEKGTQTVMKHIWEAFQGPFVLSDGTRVTDATASFGMSTYDVDTAVMLKQADNACNLSKKSVGKNGMNVHGEGEGPGAAMVSAA